MGLGLLLFWRYQIVLDDNAVVGDLVPAGQAALLRFLDSGEVRVLGGRRLPSDVRIVAATNRDLLAGAWQGTFKPDLWYRLGRLVLRLPPLRERFEDLPLLVDHLVARLNAAHGLGIDGVTSDALARLAAHPWPGNVRELQTVLERAMVLQRTGRVPAGGLRFDPLPPAGLAPASTGLAGGGGAGDPGGSGRTGPVTAGRHLPASQRPSVALELARAKGHLTRKDLMLRGGFTADTARQTLTELARAGQLHRSGRGRAVHYVPVDRR
jgi:DNA-binding NtrC family response regulator